MAMAGSSKELLAHSFKQRLQDLDCPYVDGVDESWISELLFKPGEARIRLLQWLLSRFDGKLAEMLDDQYVLSETQMDSRLQRLLQIISVMGLCKPDDIDLIRGAASSSKQTVFWDQLLDILCIADSSDNPQKRSLASPGIVSESMTLEEQFDHDCHYVSTLSAQRDLKDAFSTKLHLLPPDLLRVIENSLKEQGSEGQRLHPPERSKLDDSINKLTQELKTSEAQLGQIQNEFDFPRSDKAAINKVTQTLKLVLSELAQLVTSFSYCFESEIHQWCINKTPPRLYGLGPVFKRVHSLQRQFTDLLDSLKGIQGSYHGVCSSGQCGVNEAETRVENLVSASQAALKNFQECVGIMNDSMQRSGEAWDASTTLGTSYFGKLSLDDLPQS